MQKMHIANSEQPVSFYSLDVIIPVGYRVKSLRSTQFRHRATVILRDHLVKAYDIFRFVSSPLPVPRSDSGLSRV